MSDTLTSPAETVGDAGTTFWGFKPLPWQRGFIHDQSDEVLGSGAFGAGKTRALGEKAYLNLTLYPGNRGLLARKTFSSIANTTLKVLLDEVIPEGHIVGHNQGRHVIYVQSPFYPTIYCLDCDWRSTRILSLNKRERLKDEAKWGCPGCGSDHVEFTPASELYYEGLNTGSRPGEMPEKIAGMNLGFVGVDEGIEVSEKDWEMLQGRLRLRNLNNPWVSELPARQIFSATNPAGPNHWMHRRFFEQGVGEVYEGSAEDNIHNPDDYLPRLTAQFSGADAERYIGGEWVGYTGLVYGEFQDAIHVINPLEVDDALPGSWTVPETAQAQMEAMLDKRSTPVGDPSSPGEYVPARVYPPEDCPIVMAVDWGYRPDPLVIQWWAKTKTHGYVLYREWFQTRTLPDDAAEQAIGWMEEYEAANVAAVYADHDTGDRADWQEGVRRAVTERDWDINWARLRTTKAKKDRQDGLKTVRRLLRPDAHDRAEMYFIRGARVHDIDGNLRAEERPGSTLAEMRGYAWKDNESEEPQDEDDHGMDCLRYMAHSHKRVGTSSGTMVRRS
jgi:hypothetical protein